MIWTNNLNVIKIKLNLKIYVNQKTDIGKFLIADFFSHLLFVILLLQNQSQADCTHAIFTV